MSGNKVDGYFDADGIQIMDSHILLNRSNNMVFLYRENEKLLLGKISDDYYIEKSGIIAPSKDLVAELCHIVGEIHNGGMYIDQKLYDRLIEENIEKSITTWRSKKC